MKKTIENPKANFYIPPLLLYRILYVRHPFFVKILKWSTRWLNNWKGNLSIPKFYSIFFLFHCYWLWNWVWKNRPGNLDGLLDLWKSFDSGLTLLPLGYFNTFFFEIPEPSKFQKKSKSVQILFQKEKIARFLKIGNKLHINWIWKPFWLSLKAHNLHTAVVQKIIQNCLVQSILKYVVQGILTFTPRY